MLYLQTYYAGLCSRLNNQRTKNLLPDNEFDKVTNKHKKVIKLFNLNTIGSNYKVLSCQSLAVGVPI